MTDAWNPEQYQRFRDERSRPFFDLLAMVEAKPAMRVVDLGCGTGELTAEMHRRLAARETVGIDSSAAMLAKAAAHVGPGLTFEPGDIERFDRRGLDLVFSNAALQWLPDHERLFAKLVDALAPGGQLAVQMPANHDHPSHLTAAEVAREEPFRTALGGHERVSPVLAPERYAELLHRLGLEGIDVRLQVYAHLLDSRDGVVEWVKGTLLTDYEKRMPAELWPDFMRRYREVLLPRLDASKPYFYAFKRVLMVGRRGL